MTKYTVVGYYEDNFQAFTGEFEAESPADAMRAAIEDNGVCVVDVLAIVDGGIVSCGGNDTVVVA